jgi:NADPH-dependent curcumin reductase CurA
MSLPKVNHQWVLKRYAKPGEGILQEQFEWREVPFPANLPDGSVVVKITYLSCDPSQRVMITNLPGSPARVKPGEVMKSFGMGEVIATKNPGFAVHDLVSGWLGWQEYVISSAVEVLGWTKLPPNATPEYGLGICGISGLTAYVGLFEVVKLTAGETVLVSGAAGSVGQLVVQLALLGGARVIGIAGGPEKCEFVKRLGAADCIDYKNEKLEERLEALFPGASGIDVFFDNVGSQQLSEALRHLRSKARVALCGQIANYSDRYNPKHAIYNMIDIIYKGATINGFSYVDYKARFPVAIDRMANWWKHDKLRLLVDMQRGLENAPQVANRLFTGENIGKQILQVDTARTGAMPATVA